MMKKPLTFSLIKIDKNRLNQFTSSSYTTLKYNENKMKKELLSDCF